MPDTNVKTSLGELSELIEAISGKKLSDLLSNVGQLSDCDSHCGCHTRYCTCHGSVTSLTTGREVINPADFLEMRDAQINDLKKRLERLSQPLK